MSVYTCRDCAHGTMRDVDKKAEWSGRFRCPITGATDSMADPCPRFRKGRTQFVGRDGERIRREDVQWLR